MQTILVFGTSGCEKGKFLEQLKSSGARISGIELEPSNWNSLLTKPASERRKVLETELKRFLADIKEQSDIALIGIHATNIADAMLSSPIPIGALKEIGPEFCITIHDDLYAVQKRLQNDGFWLNYQQLLNWRNSELLVADIVASEVISKRNGIIDPPNLWLGVKHPLSSIRRLLFNPECPKVYAAFSITVPRRISNSTLKAELIKETNQYRRNLYQRGLVVFDPATLDDRLLISCVEKDTKPEGKTLSIAEDERWSYAISDEGDDSPAVKDPDSTFPLSIAHSEAFALKSAPKTVHGPYCDIDAHITQIDLRYVRQADIVTFWRPFSQGKMSTGCCTEASLASGLGKKVVAYSPIEDIEKYQKENTSIPLDRVWPNQVAQLSDEARFWNEVDIAVKEIRERRGHCVSPIVV